MTTFDKREEAFENRYAHDEEMRFKATAHRNRDLASRAAGLMSKTQVRTASCKDEIVAYASENGGDETLVRRIGHDLVQAADALTGVKSA